MYKILIADDEYEVRNGLSNYFPWKDYGFEVVYQAENGRQVLDYIKKEPIDVILCDIMMPVMTGIEVIKILFEKESPIKIVFISGHKDFEYARQALKYGVSDYLLKPTKNQDLITLCEKLKADLDRKKTLENNLTDPKDHLNGCNYYQQIILTVKNYLENHYQDASLEKVAELVHMNPIYLSKFFKEKTGENFSDFLLLTRMKKAAELLLDISYRTYEVSEMVGYSNPKNFTRAFKNFYGKTPREYRNYLDPSPNNEMNIEELSNEKD